MILKRLKLNAAYLYTIEKLNLVLNNNYNEADDSWHGGLKNG